MEDLGPGAEVVGWREKDDGSEVGRLNENPNEDLL